jgi:hypothetical protein
MPLAAVAGFVSSRFGQVVLLPAERGNCAAAVLELGPGRELMPDDGVTFISMAQVLLPRSFTDPGLLVVFTTLALLW